jgi:hypothetical protein
MSSNRLIPFCLFPAVVSAGEARGFVGFLPHSAFLFSLYLFRNFDSPINPFTVFYSSLVTQHFSSACPP